MLKIERISVKGRMRVRLIGNFKAEHINQVKAEIEICDSAPALDLKEVDLVDLEAVRFLNACRLKGTRVLHAPTYIRTWMVQERRAAGIERTMGDSGQQLSQNQTDFRREGKMVRESEQKNKELVLKGFETLFNRRDYAAAEKFWSPDYIQHSAHVPPGRDGLFNLVRSMPMGFKYEHGLIVADGEYVIVHGRFSEHRLGPVNWVAADILRIKDGVMAEHWDVLQDEASRSTSKSGLPMFGDTFSG